MDGRKFIEIKKPVGEVIGGTLTVSYGVPVAWVVATGATAVLGKSNKFNRWGYSDSDALKVAGDTAENVERVAKLAGEGIKKSLMTN